MCLPAVGVISQASGDYRSMDAPLHPLLRRRFLGGAGAGLSGIALAHLLQGEAQALEEPV
jgi:hypothetical protein